MSGSQRLLVLDVDSTFIKQEVIELLAARAGSLDTVARITDRAMRGEIDFAESLEERVATLAGLPESVFAEVYAEVELSEGAVELVSALKAEGWTVALVSGGFTEVVSLIAVQVGIELFRANGLEVSDGLLTGKTTGPVIDRAAKAAALREFADALGVPLADTVAIGDGANDLDMMAAAGLGIAFNAKPVVQHAADVAITSGRLDDALELIER